MTDMVWYLVTHGMFPAKRGGTYCYCPWLGADGRACRFRARQEATYRRHWRRAHG